MRRYRRRPRSQYFLPFVVLLSLGVFIILAFQIWGMFFSSAKGDALYYMAEGRSKVLSFGTSEWENLYNGSKLKLGDAVKTLKSSKGVIEFYDGTLLRMDEDTQITLLDISKKNDYQEILIYLDSGNIWVNKPKQNVIRKTDFVISTDYASYAITGTIFALEKDASEEKLRVMKGQVEVNIIEEVDGKTRTIETIPVGIGQQVTLSDRVMSEFYERKSPSVLGAMDTLFQTSKWYIWNNREDQNPSDFTKNTSDIIDDNEASPNSSLEYFEGDESSAPKSEIGAPELVAPKNTTIVTEVNEQKLEGKAKDGTKKILLKQTLANQETTRILVNSFDMEALTFDYDISAEKGNILVGNNVYEFVGVDENARETEALRVEIEYKSTEPDLVNDKQVEVGDSLSDPAVKTVNGKNYNAGMIVEDNAFAITGTAVGANAVEVNGYRLSQFKSGNASWTYNVNTSYGNVKAGKNSYTVYAFTEGGQKSSPVEIVLDFQPKEPIVVSSASEEKPNESASTGNSTSTDTTVESTETTGGAVNNSESESSTSVSSTDITVDTTVIN